LSFLGMDIGWGELLIILIVALLVVGPDKLPAYARKTARFVRNFQKVTTGLTGQISKAINLEDEEDGKAAGFKKDLIEVKKSLEKDVADLKATLDAQSKAVSETMEAGTKDATDSLEQNAREISETLNTQAGELKATLDAQAKAVSETVESSVKDAAAGLEQGAREISAAVSSGTEGAPLAEQAAPESVPVPPPPLSDAEVN
jgi:sec-independent protein translocase protein TatB